ncbi:diguanylate cyclase [Aquabacterium sp.]|uniref:GGDEF domain-containing protein n=1 Tax=Aquabacterium sp. TaxID=1872578 RepID=UPI003783E392
MTDLHLPPLLWLVAYQMGLHALLWGACSLLLREARAAVLHWAVFMLLLGTGLALAGARNEPREWLFYNGANLATVLAFAVMRRGTQLFMRVESHDREQLGVLLPILVVIGLAGPSPQWAPLRIVLSYAVQAFIVLRLMAVIGPALKAEFGRAAMWAVGGPGLLIGLIQVALAGHQAFSWRAPAEMQQDTGTNQALMYVYLAGAALFTFLFIVMVTQRLLASLREAAVRDPLTGLLNRRAMAEAMERQWLRHRRTQSPLAVLVIDIDHFKRINDTLGHAAGDSVLIHLSTLLQNHVRGEDVVGRVGGEEFLLVLPDTQPQNAIALAERLRVLVRAESLGTTISIGIAIAHSVDDSAESVIARADAALYRAKDAGRNRIEVAD